jgi:hypothetical protein
MSNEGFKGVPGVPDGWELLHANRSGEPGEHGIDSNGRPVEFERKTLFTFPIIRKIEVPKKYRPFANAEEFEPHRDRWTMHPREPHKRFKPGDYNDSGVWSNDHRFYTYAELLESGLLFDDGTPFGVEVTSE